MAFKAKDGKAFGNRQQMKAYDERVPKGNGASHQEPDGDEPGAGQGEGDDVSSQSIHEVVQEHGPAHKIVTHHDHESGVHKVHSHHGDGKVHKSEHGSAEEAHDHAAQAAGLGELDAGEKTGQPLSAAGSPGSAGDYGIPGM